jgi:Transposase IS4
MGEVLFDDKRFGLGIDTLTLAKYAMKHSDCSVGAGVPTAYNLPTLFQFVTGKLPSTSHRAKSDVDATATTIFRYPIFWEKRKQCFFQFQGKGDKIVLAAEQATTVRLPIEDSDSCELSSGSSSSSSDNDDEVAPLGDRWFADMDFEPQVGQTPMALFKEHFTSTGRSGRDMTGLQCSPIDVNTPMRAWRQIFTNSILDKIVRYTNEYGQLNVKRWSDISQKDFESFIAILFISGI